MGKIETNKDDKITHNVDWLGEFLMKKAFKYLIFSIL